MFSGFASLISERWQNNTQTIATGLFNDTNTLGALIDEGLFFTDTAPTLTAYNQTQQLVKAFFSNMLLAAWGAGSGVGQVYIL